MFTIECINYIADDSREYGDDIEDIVLEVPAMDYAAAGDKATRLAESGLYDEVRMVDDYGIISHF